MADSIPYKSVSATTSATDAQISDGAKERVAWSESKWRLSDTGSFTAGQFVVVPANQPVPVTKNAKGYARGDSGTVTVYVVDVIK
jgi:hypothetical protein